MRIAPFRSKHFSWFYILLCALIAFSNPAKSAAQPGDRRSAEEIEKDFLERLAQANRDVEKNPASAEMREKRGEIYATLYRTSRQRRKDLDDAPLAENGIADFTRALELTETVNLPAKAKAIAQARIFSRRAELFKTIWILEFNKIHEKSPAEKLAHLYTDENFARASADYAQAAALDPGERYHFLNHSNLYFFRAEQFSFAPELFNEARFQNKETDVWNDFDEAARYAARAPDFPYGKQSVINIYLKKGDTAFKFEKYDVALEAYRSDVKYAGKNYELLCDESEENSYCPVAKRSNMSLFSFKRAKTYLKLGDAEKVLSELKIYFAGALHDKCPQPLVLRMQAYRKLGQTEAAQAEEKRLREMPAVSGGGCYL